MQTTTTSSSSSSSSSSFSLVSLALLYSPSMEEIDEAETNWLDGFGEEEYYFTNSFIDSTTAAPVLVEHKDMQVELGADAPPPPTCVSVMNKLISTVYSGPTISDIESALSISYRCGGGTDDSRSNYRPSILLPEKGIGKAENKYTLRIKSCGSILADDGYKWRKYGQKSIKNSPNPRSYYRCTNPRCNAKKQVEKSTEDPHMLIVTYEGLHLHYTYSHFLLPKPKDSPSSTADLHMSKKPRTQTNPVAAPQVAEPKKQSRVTAIPDEQKVQQKQQQQQEQTENTGEGRTQEGFLKDFVTKGPVTVDEDLQHGLMLSGEHSPQGLLEDVVPWLVRKPCSSIVCASPNEQSSSYSDQASSPSNSSSLSWSPNYCYLDAAILSDIITSL